MAQGKRRLREIPSPGARKDVILVDAYERKCAAPELATAHFYHEVWRRLSVRGVLVVNVFGNAYQRLAHAALIRGVFGERVMLLPVREYENLIVLAFRTDAPVHDWERLERRASTLKGRLGLDFPLYLRTMLHSFAETAPCGPT